MMKKTAWLLSLLSIGVAAPAESAAETRFGKDGLTGDYGKLQLRGRFSASVQGALIDPVEPAPLPPAQLDRTGSALDGSARLSLEYTADNAWVFGVAADVDTANEDIQDFERDELYVYAASEWGRIEIGENDGPGDTLSFHAPQVGLGQVRGDFARYSGTVALLSPYDSRDSAKVTYLSPPVGGLRVGASYAPEFEINADDPVVTRRLIQENVFELGAQYVQPLGDWVVGLSASYIAGEADPVTLRGDMQSWGVGMELRRGQLTLGAAYVDRGNSNLALAAQDESEWNAGASWTADRWSVAASVAVGDENAGDVSRYGVGGEYSLTENLYVRADAVMIEQKPVLGVDRDGAVGLLEFGVRY